MDSSDEWTTVHDLALIYSGLACIDRELTEEEVEVIRDRLLEWVPLSVETAAQGIVQEAARALKQSEREVRQAVRRVGRRFDSDERHTALQGLLRIAEADGVLLERERALIHTLATAWDLKQVRGVEGTGPPTGAAPRDEEAGMVHDMAVLFVQGLRENDDELSATEVEVMADRLQEWRPGLSDEERRAVLRRARQASADQSEEPLPEDSVDTLEEALSDVQQLLLLDDLYAISQADGRSTRRERQIILSLAEAWGLNVRLKEGP